MTANLILLPNNVDALQALVLDLSGQLASRALEIEHLKLLIAKLKRMQFGRKSEKLDRQIGQLELKLEDLETERAEAIATEGSKDIQQKRQREPRKPLPAYLPREPRDHFVEEVACPQCGGNLKNLGEDIGKQLELIPARFKVIRHVRHKLACACCDYIVQGRASNRPIDRSLPGPTLMAHVAVLKFCDYPPLYRQSNSYAREDVELSRSTLIDWIGRASCSEPTAVANALRRCIR